MANSSNFRIIIRKAKVGDEKGLMDMQREGLKRKNWLYTGSNTATKEKQKKIRESLKSKKPDTHTFVAIDKETGKLVGSVGIYFRRQGRLRHRVGLGWGVHPDYQGRGIATSLLNGALRFAKRKGFKRAEAEIAVKNIGSWKIAKKCGFRIEGRKRKALLTDDGQYIDTYVVGKIL